MEKADLLLSELGSIVGPRNVIFEADALVPYSAERRGRFSSNPRAVVRPATTNEVSGVVSLCRSHGVAIVPQGGNTGLTGASVAADHEVILQLGRLNRVRRIDPANLSMEVEAGVILADVQRHAAESGCLFPLSLASEGSCQIGGNIATNAGGVAVLRYGNMRDLVLGLEAVLPDGRVWNGLQALRKDNTGLDLKNLLIGSEGTLGVVTAAVLRLYPAVRRRATAWVGLRRVEDALAVLETLEAAHAQDLTALELVPRVALEMVLGTSADLRDPLAQRHEQYLLAELTSSAPGPDLSEGLGQTLGVLATLGAVQDATIASSEEQAKLLWELRERISDAQGHFGGSIKHDISVPRSSIPSFLRDAGAAVRKVLPDVIFVSFGHVGDGNLHYNLTQPPGMDRGAFLARWSEMNRIVHDVVAGYGGSIAAEHGIGLARRDELVHYADPLKMRLMAGLKLAFDPAGVLNPGKVVRP